jgi:integrase/recombinase XerC
MIHEIDEVIERRPRRIVPDLVLAMGDKAVECFQDLFETEIYNDKTRAAYLRSVEEFLSWCSAKNLRSMNEIQPGHVEAWLTELKSTLAFSTIKLRLTGLRHVFHWLTVGGVLPVNPIAGVRGPRRMVRKCRTTVLSAEEVRALTESIDGDGPVDLRDKALIGLMLFSFAWIDSILEMRLNDVFIQNRRLKIRLCAKVYDIPLDHGIVDQLRAYIDAIDEGRGLRAPLFRTVGRSGGLTRQALNRSQACEMVRHRMETAGLKTSVGNQCFRATGITVFRNAGKPLPELAHRL